MATYYVLKGTQAVPTDDELKCLKQLTNIDVRRVARTEVQTFDVTFDVSTVFLAINHGTDEKPLLFETMIFNAAHQSLGEWESLGEWRYATWDEAIKGHESICDLVRRGELPVDTP